VTRVALSTSVLPWTLQMPAGSLQQWTFTLTSPQAVGGPLPYPVSGATWEYVVRASATDLIMPLASITTSASAAGLVTVTATATLSQAVLAIYPVATAGLAGIYSHALWMNPGTPSALCVAEGVLQVIASPQP
jgi:hypothetical protein